jgi:hypothetical protein
MISAMNTKSWRRGVLNHTTELMQAATRIQVQKTM